MSQYRQGDVFLEKVSSVPAKLKPVAKENGRVVLAHGEVTGHHHSLSEGSLMEAENGDRYLVLEADGTLTHQEHSEIALPAGNYIVRRQREYEPQGVRNVMD